MIIPRRHSSPSGALSQTSGPQGRTPTFLFSLFSFLTRPSSPFLPRPPSPSSPFLFSLAPFLSRSPSPSSPFLFSLAPFLSRSRSSPPISHLPSAISGPQGQRGSALMAVFWMIAVMGMVLFAATKMLHADTSGARVTRDRMFAKRYAEMGLEVGRHPAIELYDPLLTYSTDAGGGYNVQITTEEARFNINLLLLNSDRAILKRIFTAWNFKPEFTSRLLDALKDWVDADDLTSLNGAEKREYEKMGLEKLPFNRPFKNLDEMLLVRGMDAVNAAQPGWRDWFTVYGDGRIDVNEARPDFISVLTATPMQRLTPLLTLRNGRDGAHHTMDDGRLSSAVQIAQLLAITEPKIIAELQQWVQFAGPIRRIESTGTFNTMSRKIVLITQNNLTLWRGEMPGL